MAAEQVKLLEDRAATLEHAIFGPSGAAEKVDSNISDEILAVNARLARLAQQHEVVNRFWGAYGDVATMLNTHTFEDALLSTGAKEEIILAAEATLREIAEQLQSLHALGDFLNTPALQDVPTLAPKLAPLEKLNITNREELDKLSQRASAVMTSYNEIVALLSRKFLLWDRTISELERRVGEAVAANE